MCHFTEDDSRTLRSFFSIKWYEFVQGASKKSLVGGMTIFLFGKKTWLLGRSSIIFMQIRFRRTVDRTQRGKLIFTRCQRTYDCEHAAAARGAQWRRRRRRWRGGRRRWSATSSSEEEGKGTRQPAHAGRIRRGAFDIVVELDPKVRKVLFLGKGRPACLLGP